MARLRGAAHEQRWPEDADGLWGEPPRVDPPRRADGPAERGLCQEIDRVGGEGLDHGRAVVECRGLVVWRSINLWGKKIFFFFFGVLVLVSCAAPSPRSSQDFFGGRLRRVSGPRLSFSSLGWNREGPRLGRNGLGEEVGSCSDLPILHKNVFTCFSLSFSSHGLEISDDKMKNALFRGRKFTILGPCGILNWLTRQFISSSERRKKKNSKIEIEANHLRFA